MNDPSRRGTQPTKEMSPVARQLFAAASSLNSAPEGHFHVGRERLAAALAAGAVTSAAVITQGATLSAAGAAAAATPTASATMSIAATWLSAVAIGLSTGLVALSPASRTDGPRQREIYLKSTTRAAESRVVGAPPLTRERLLSEPLTTDAPRAASSSAVAVAAASAFEPSPPRTGVLVVSSGAPESARVTSAKPSASGVVAPSKPANIRSIADETRILTAVQRALDEGRPAQALAILDSYRKRCPSGQLHEEENASRVVALCAAGRTAEGQRAAADFARQYPTSPLLSRVGRACSTLRERSVSDAATGGDGT